MNSVWAVIGATAALLLACTIRVPLTTSPWASESFPTTAPRGPSSTFAGTIDQRFTTPALDYRNTGEWLVWSTGARGAADDAAPDLYAVRPGETPQLVYDNPERDSRLEVVGGDGSRFVFMEFNDRAFGIGQFKLWYISSPGAAPVVIDEGDAAQLPFFAMSGDRVVWTAVHGDPERSELHLLDVTSMKRRVLLASDPAELQYWFPAIDGDHLVYGTVEPNVDYSSDQRHVYLVDLAAGGKPIRLDRSQSASQPAIAGDTVIWKESDPELHMLNAGKLVRYSLSRRTLRPVDLPVADRLMGFTFPSVGKRFATAWHDDFRHLYVQDVRTDKITKLEDFETPEGDPEHDRVSRAEIHGELLSYVFGPKKGDLELRWIDLAQAFP